MKSPRKFIILFILLLLMPVSAIANKNRIAVMDFRAEGRLKEKALWISELIRTEIVNTGVYTVIERSQMDMMFKEQGIQQIGVINDAYAIKMGELLSAQKILIGTVMQLGDAIIISGRIVDIEKGVAEFAVNQSVANENDLLEATKLLCRKLTGTTSHATEIPGVKKKKIISTAKESIESQIHHTGPAPGIRAKKQIKEQYYLSSGGENKYIKMQDRFEHKAGNIIYDKMLKKRWRVVGDEIFSWEEAKKYVEQMEGNFRLPKKDELITLVTKTKSDSDWGKIDSYYFPSNSRSNRYWCSDEVEWYESGYYFIDFDKGNAQKMSKLNCCGLLAISDEE